MNKLRAEREKLGLKRLEVWAPPSVHQQIKDFVAKLQRKRKEKA